jgi:ABC-type bacteriocin/lantibiotic exporter with double-glycine peptidase domain
MYKTVWKSLKEVLRESKFISIFFLFLAQLSNLSNLVYGYISKLYVDKVSDYLSNKVTFQIATKSLIYITIGAICFYVLNTMFDALYDYIWGYWKADTYKRLRLKYIQRLKDLPLPVYEAESVGRVQEKIGAGTNSKVEIANTIITNLFPELVLVSVALPILFRKNSSLALVGLMGLPLFVIVRYLMFKKVKPHLLGARKAGEDYGAIENELFHRIKIIKAFNKSDFQYNYLKDKAELQLKEQVTVNTIYRVYNIFSRLTVQIPRAIVVGLAAYIALQGKLTAGDVMLFATYVGSVTQPLWNLSRALNAMQEQSTKSERLDELLKNESEFANDSDKNVKNLNESISFNSVSYSYENKRDVLKGLNLTIEKDKVTALVGPSGVGKSTVVKLLLRFTEPTKGEVLIGNINFIFI